MTHEDPETSSATLEADGISATPPTAESTDRRPSGRRNPQLFRVEHSPMFYSARMDPERKRRVRLSLRTSDPDIARWRAIEWAREADRILGVQPSFRAVPTRIAADVDLSPCLEIYSPADAAKPGKYEGLHEVEVHRDGVRSEVELRASKLDLTSRTWQVTWIRTLQRDPRTHAPARRAAARTAEDWRRDGVNFLTRIPGPAPQQVLLTTEGVRDLLDFSLAMVSRWSESGKLPDPLDDGLGREGRIRPRRWCEAELRQWISWDLPSAMEFRRRLQEGHEINRVNGGRGA